MLCQPCQIAPKHRTSGILCEYLQKKLGVKAGVIVTGAQRASFASLKYVGKNEKITFLASLS